MGASSVCVKPGATEILNRMAQTYSRKLPAGYHLRINIEIRELPDQQPGEVLRWHVVSHEGGLEYGLGAVDGADTELRMTYETLLKLYTGVWSGLGAASRGHIKDPAPMDFSIPAGVHPLEAMRRGYYFVTHFFTVTDPTVIPFGPQHVRGVHGAQAAPLFYATGLRSAYYLIAPQDKLNADGARDPMHQAFIVIGGDGLATIGESRFPVRRGQAVYVPPDTVHILETAGAEPLEIIWLAWGEKA